MHRAWVWWVALAIALVALLVGTVLARLDMVGMPETVVEATSDAVVFQPATIVDIVELARPRFGLSEDLRVFDGIRLDPPLHTDTLLRAFGVVRPSGRPDSVLLIQRFQVTAACQVGIERMLDRLIRIDIRSDGSASGQDAGEPCMVSAEALLGNAARFDAAVRQEIDVTIAPATPASLEVRPLEPLRLRRFAVSRLGFMTSESGSPESAIRGAVVRLPDYGIDSDTVFLGDRLTLGELEGELTEVDIGSAIRTLFKGRASDPVIGDRRLKPSMLRQLVHWEPFTIIIAVTVTLISMLMAIFQVALRS